MIPRKINPNNQLTQNYEMYFQRLSNTNCLV